MTTLHNWIQKENESDTAYEKMLEDRTYKSKEKNNKGRSVVRFHCHICTNEKKFHKFVDLVDHFKIVHPLNIIPDWIL